MEHLPKSAPWLRRVSVEVPSVGLVSRKPETSASFQGSSLPKVSASILLLSCATARPRAAKHRRNRGTVRRQQLSPTTTNPLNPSQQEAVSAELKGHKLIIAGAGSGKTTVLVQRLVRLLNKEKVDPSKVVLLTFTKSAAEEMKTRARHLVGSTKADAVLACTFHAFCSRVLRRYGRCIEIPGDFVILSESDAQTLIRMARKKLGFDNKSHYSGFPQPRALRELFSRSVRMDQELRQILCGSKQYQKYAYLAEDIETCQQEYEKKKKEHGALDFDDLQLKCQELLQNEEICKKVAKDCQHILVDEYQDTDKVQDAILKSINSTLTVVGDDAQSIYGFRGAAIENIHNFEENYPDVTVFKLEQNYRSDQPILDLANGIMYQSSKGYSKNLFSKRQGGNLPKLCHFKDSWAEARWVVQQLLQLHQEGIAWRDMAALFRRRKASSQLEAELQAHHVPYRLVGGHKMLESKHARDLFALLQCATTPRHMLAWKRVLCLIQGIGEKTAEKIFEDIFEEQRLRPEKWEGKIYFEELSSLAKVLEEIHELNHDPTECVRLAKKWYDPYLIQSYVDNEECQDRREDFLVFEDMMSKWETLSMALQEMLVVGDQEAQKDRDMVTLTTIHGAKGLEWNTVFIIDMVEYCPWMEKKPEEELRVMYVGITRACQRLYLCCPAPPPELSNWLRMLPNLENDQEEA